MKKIRYFQIKNWSDVIPVLEEHAGQWLAENNHLRPKTITQEQYDIFMFGYNRGYRDGIDGD